MKEQKIITHPGSAHFDDVTAISLVLAVNEDTDFGIERREPMPEELEDPDVWVIDIGNRHEPDKHNFDHHQSLDCPASFVLVANYLGLTERLSVMPWWDFKDEVDRFGSRNSSEKFNAGDDLINKNPVEDWFAERFASDIEKTMPLLKSFGSYLIEEAEKLKKQIEVLRSSTRVDIAGVPTVISETRETIGLEEFRRLENNPPDIVISLDRRDDGWRVFRYEGTPVDLTLISDDPRVSFAHKSGFLAKTKGRLGTDELIDLVSKAVVRINETGNLSFDPEILIQLTRMRMPFGKYKDRVLCDLPEPYLMWFQRRGFPSGKLGLLLESLYEIRLNGLEYLLKPFREKS